jgi:hypothetical protein
MMLIIVTLVMVYVVVECLLMLVISKLLFKYTTQPLEMMLPNTK